MVCFILLEYDIYRMIEELTGASNTLVSDGLDDQAARQIFVELQELASASPEYSSQVRLWKIVEKFRADDSLTWGELIKGFDLAFESILTDLLSQLEIGLSDQLTEQTLVELCKVWRIAFDKMQQRQTIVLEEQKAIVNKRQMGDAIERSCVMAWLLLATPFCLIGLYNLSAEMNKDWDENIYIVISAVMVIVLLTTFVHLKNNRIS